MQDEEKEKLMQTPEYQETMEETPFMYLTCDLPPAPLYPDDLQENIIPQVNNIFSHSDFKLTIYIRLLYFAKLI